MENKTREELLDELAALTEQNQRLLNRVDNQDRQIANLKQKIESQKHEQRRVDRDNGQLIARDHKQRRQLKRLNKERHILARLLRNWLNDGWRNMADATTVKVTEWWLEKVYDAGQVCTEPGIRTEWVDLLDANVHEAA